MKHLYLYGIFFFVFQTMFAQDFDNYQFVRSSNPIPSDFLTLSSKKYKESVESDPTFKREKQKIRQQKKDFYLKNSFVIDELLLSGRILFNDPISAYVNKVADQLLIKQPELRKKVRFYVIKSKIANAFATDGGMVFINMGLLAQLENEAQLAFILAHEISHFSKKHSVNEYLEDQKIQSKKGDYRRLSVDDKFLAKMTYSKELEMAADDSGLSFFLASGYAAENIENVFEVLKYADLPFEDKAVSLSFLETDFFHFPKEYYLKETKSIEIKEENDSKSTHPSTDKRKENIVAQLKTTTTAAKGMYLVSEKEFKTIQKIARFEICNLYLKNMEYVNAIYTSYLLLLENPDSRYLHKIIGTSLIQMAKYANIGKSNTTTNQRQVTAAHSKEESPIPTYEYEQTQGASQRLTYLFHKMSSEELTTLAVRYNWKLRMMYPNDSTLREASEIALRELAFSGISSLKQYVAEKPALDPVENPDSLAKEASKMDKIKKAASEKPYYHYAFIGFLENADFVKNFESFVQEKQQADKKSKPSWREKRKWENKLARRGLGLGVNKIVLVHTEYLKIDDRKRNKKFLFIESEEKKNNFNMKINQIAKKIGVQTTWLEPRTLTATDGEKFNDYAMLREWFSKKMLHDNIEIPHLTAEQKKAFIARYGTSYVCWMGTINLTQRAPVGTVFYSLLLPYLTPMFATKAFTPNSGTLYFATVFNIEDEKVYLVDYRVVNSKDAAYVIHANIYNTLNQIHYPAK